ncbi:hypothetical protein LJ221_01420 [Streptomyces sp. CNQ085]|nr:hypothetical protein [Streptomyces sp. CNQ085]MCI0383103.1 hypothetical protein [Streptomyces sp. CNQ085]
MLRQIREQAPMWHEAPADIGRTDSVRRGVGALTRSPSADRGRSGERVVRNVAVGEG